MGWYSSGVGVFLPPNDSGTITIVPDGEWYTPDGSMRGEIDATSVINWYDRADLQLLPGFEYTFENVIDSASGLHELISVADVGSEWWLLSYFYFENDTSRDALSSDYPLTVTEPTWVALTITGFGFDEDDLQGRYQVNVYADPIVLSTFDISATDADKSEGSSDDGLLFTSFTFTITREGFPTQPARVDWSVSSAVADASDFDGVGLPSGRVSFASGETSNTLTIQVGQDSDIEADEPFTVTLDAVGEDNAIGVASATGVIRNDDFESPPTPPSTVATYSIAPLDANKAEGAPGDSTGYTFAVTRVGESLDAADIDWSIGSEQVDASDLVSGALSGRLSFAAGESSEVLRIDVRGDAAYEPHEIFFVYISAPPDATDVVIDAGSARGVIRNDDPLIRTTPLKYAADPSFLFDPVYYLWASPELVPVVTLESALQHYLDFGSAAGKQPTAWFDASYYEQRWADLTPLQLDDATLFAHFNLYGVWEGRSPAPAFDQFDGNRYLAENQDVAGYVDTHVDDFLGSRSNGAIAHFIIYGSNEGRLAYDSTGSLIDMGYVV